jgi:predicted acetyltransferase
MNRKLNNHIQELCCNMIKLVLPNTKYKTTYLHAVKEFIENGSDNESTDHYLKTKFDELNNNFDSFVILLIDMHKGRNLKEGYVPSTEFWIIDENSKYCGRISLRHKLNDLLSKHGGHIGYDIIPSERGKKYASKALGLCLKKAKKMGLSEVLLTCDDNNLASYKTIESNNGILKDKIKHADILSRRYSIKI